MRKQQQLLVLILFCLLWSGKVAAVQSMAAQGTAVHRTVVQRAVDQRTGSVAVQVRLRDSEGTAVIGEPVVLERLPEEEAIAPDCVTDANGECTWTVGRGLYQVLFTRPLDDISALAVAEGGLRSFGITVGDADIVYHFTFHNDGHAYFDASPEAAVPSPIIPTADALHGGTVSTPALLVIDGELVGETPTPEPTHTPDTAVTTSGNSWRLILFIGGGLVIGGGLHLWSRKRHKTTRLPDQESKNA